MSETFKPYHAGRGQNIGTGWRQRQDRAAERIADRIAEAQDEERQRIREERARIYAAKSAQEEAERVELVKHEFVAPPAELAGHVKGIAQVKRSFLPFLQDAVAAYLAQHPDQRPKQAVATYRQDGVIYQRSDAEMAGLVPSAEERAHAASRAADTTQAHTLSGRILQHVGESEPVRRGRGRPRKQPEATTDGFILEDDSD